MNIFSISDSARSLVGEVFPDYGGMLGELVWNAKPILYLDREMISLSPLLAGGCPILFPFPSRTEDDRYELFGKTYSMPFHGLVKDTTFEVIDSSETSICLYTTNNEVMKRCNYPFDFGLFVQYTILNDSSVVLETRVQNRSSREMSHYFGWHPYFVASDKSACELHLNFEQYSDYGDGKIHSGKDPLSLTRETDYVFFGKKDETIELINYADGFRATIELDEEYQVVTVCTKFDGCICVEPWLGLPDSIHSGRFLQKVGANSSKHYAVRLTLSRC